MCWVVLLRRVLLETPALTPIQAGRREEGNAGLPVGGFKDRAVLHNLCPPDWLGLSVMATPPAREAGKCSPVICQRRKKEKGNEVQPAVPVLYTKSGQSEFCYIRISSISHYTIHLVLALPHGPGSNHLTSGLLR